MKRLALAAAVTLLAVSCSGRRASEQASARPDAADAVTQQISEAELPDTVRAAVHAHPRAVLHRAVRVTHGATVTYDLTLTGTRKTHMIVGADGRVISFE
jgi:transcription elongation GreA/GreB family factor